MDNLEKIWYILRKGSIETMNRPITSTEIETMIRDFPANKSPGPDVFTGWYYQNFREEITPILLKLFQKFGMERKLSNSFYEVSITLITKPVTVQRHHKRKL